MTHTYNVSGMTCPGCQPKVETARIDMDSIASLQNCVQMKRRNHDEV